MCVYIQDDYKRNSNQDQQLRSLAENHGRQMEYLQLRNRDLEKQRDGKMQYTFLIDVVTVFLHLFENLVFITWCLLIIGL